MLGTQYRWFSHGLVMAGPLAVLLFSPPLAAQSISQVYRTGPPIILNGAIDPASGQPVAPNGATPNTRKQSGQPSRVPAPVLATPPRQTRRARAGTVVPRDGDLLRPAIVAPVDGVIDLSGPPPVIDGADPQQTDTRLPQDRDAFASPPAGFDPLLFQIEDTRTADPHLNRRPQRLFENEPYDPVGMRFGSFVLFPQSETGMQWSSNVFASPQAQSDVSYVTRPSARLVSNWNTHAIELRGSTELSSYNEFKTEDARGYELEARGRLDVTRRMNVQGVLSHQVSQESRSAIDASTVGDRADVVTDRASVALNRRFNRLTVQLRGAVTNYEYGSVDVTALNGTISNDDRNFIETNQAARASWEFKPTLRTFGEVELIQRDFETAAASDGVPRDSQGARYRVGINFGDNSDIIRGEVSLGYGDHRPNDERLEAVDGLIVDANLAWRVNALTSLLFTARTDVTDTTTTNSAGVFERQTGLAVRHAFREHLIGTAGASYTTRNLAGVDIDEADLQFNLGVEYFLNRTVTLFGTYAHTTAWSDFADSDYDLDEIYVGMRLRR